VDSLKPWLRSLPNAASRFGPIFPDAFASRSVWHVAHLEMKSALPFDLSPFAEMVVPTPELQPAAAREKRTSVAATRLRTLRGPWASRPERGHRLLARRMDREHAVE